MENDGAKIVTVVAEDDEVGPVPYAELVDRLEQAVRGVPREDVRQARLDADADERQPAGRLPAGAAANCSSPSLTPGARTAASDAARDSDMAMSR